MTWLSPMQQMPGYDLLTELRMRIVALEDRVRRLEELKHRAALGIREWWPVILGTIALGLAIMGKITWGEAISVLKAATGSSS